MSDRGIKKWNAYKSLFEQFDALETNQKRRKIQQKPTISDDEIEHINYVLVNYRGQILHITYFRKGELFEISSPIKKISVQDRKLYLPNDLIIKFDELIYLEDSSEIFDD